MLQLPRHLIPAAETESWLRHTALASVLVEITSLAGLHLAHSTLFSLAGLVPHPNLSNRRSSKIRQIARTPRGSPSHCKDIIWVRPQLAMAGAADLQAFLRFLTQDAKVPLALAMSKVKQMQSVNLGSASSIATAKLSAIQEVFASEDDAAEKVAKQVHNAAKRVNKRKASDQPDGKPQPRKRQKPSDQQSPAEYEESLSLPEASNDTASVEKTVLITNRAPLVLAFAVTLLKYTMPSQPLSSRLSLAQAQVSSNARSKAISLGIAEGSSAQDEGWGIGQPGVRVMGREVKAMKRWGYNAKSAIKPQGPSDVGEAPTAEEDAEAADSPLWGLDIEALKKTGDKSRVSGALPIHTPESARAYLLKSFHLHEDENSDRSAKGKPRKKAEELEQNLGLLLGALEMLYQSWSKTLSHDELDKRSWSWYVQVRPDVEHGPAGWGGKGQVKLSEILKLCRKEDVSESTASAS